MILSNVCVKSEQAEKLQRTDDSDENLIKYILITDETIEPNKFEIS